MSGMAWFFLLMLVVTNLAWFFAYDRLMHDARRAVMMSGRHPAGTGSSVEEGGVPCCISFSWFS